MRGWILDLYAESPGKMVVWLKTESGETRRLVDRWAPSIFAASDSREDLTALEKGKGRDFAWSRFVTRLERATDRGESEVLELVVDDAKKLAKLAESIELSRPFGTYRLYNVDVPTEQMYFYENDLFPLAYCDVTETRDGLAWELRDDIWACEYAVPELRSLDIEVAVRKSGRMPRFDDPLASVRLKKGDGSIVNIDRGSEEASLMELVEQVKRADPDIIFTNDGDAFVLPYLAKRAAVNGIAERFSIDRDGNALEAPAKKGTSYFSYGKILFKPSAVKLLGRIHLDTTSSFVHKETGLEGFYEVSRICRLPLHTASRASIGKALSSLQFYHATNDGILIPWKPTMAEAFKSRAELLVADRGGFIFEPELGAHDEVAEFDFASLFPSIMSKKNISPETVRCSCCPDSANRVPELDWNVCERRPKGIVPKAVEILVEKRARYKRLEKRSGSTDEERARYQARRDALKWVAVACLPREAPVFIRNDGVDRFVKIGEFIDELVGNKVGVIECPPGVYVAGVGKEDYKAKYCKVAYLIKKPNKEKLLSFVMTDGRNIVTTPDHSFFVLRDGELKVKKAKKLEVGEIIPAAKKIPSPGNGIQQIDLIERLKNLLGPKEQQFWRVSGDQLKEAIKAKWQILVDAAVPEGYSYQSVRSWIKSGIIPLEFFDLLDLDQENHQDLMIGSGRRKGGRIAWLPAVLSGSEELGFFLGLYVADGSAGRNFIRLDIGEIEPDLLENARRIIVNLFGVPTHVYKERRARMFVLQINSASLVQVLNKIFGLPGSAERGKLKVPEIVFDSEQMALGFIEGMVAGDGFASKTQQFVNIGTTSKELLNQLAFLSTRLGLTFRIGDLHTDTNTINFVGPETLRRIMSWKFLKRKHNDLVTSYTKDCSACSHPYYQRIPTLESGLYALTRVTGTSYKPYVKPGPGHSMCPVRVNKKISKIRTQKLNQQEVLMADKIDGLINSDLGFVKIKEILQTDSIPDYVYCFQLETDEVPGFFTGQGVILTRNCFGYLGFNNAKFGRIDAHIAVCAWDRKILIDAARVAERRGFRVMHGIVDSLWLKREGATEEDYRRLRREIEAETGFNLSFEGIYRWIAFAPSKVYAGVPVLNRYFGAYRDGRIKVRGIEARRHDTPVLFSKCQLEILAMLAKAESVKEAAAMVEECIRVFLRYAWKLLDHEAPIEELVFTRNLSRKPGEYVNRSLTACVAAQLVREGVELHAGETVQYVITDYWSKSPSKRAVPLDLVDGKTVYDAKRYVELLAEACSTVLLPFRVDCSPERLVQFVNKGILRLEALGG